MARLASKHLVPLLEGEYILLAGRCVHAHWKQDVTYDGRGRKYVTDMFVVIGSSKIFYDAVTRN